MLTPGHLLYHQTLDYITRKGAYAMLKPNNYGRYYGNAITDASGFEAFLDKVAKEFASNDKVIADTNKEYKDSSVINITSHMDQKSHRSTQPGRYRRHPRCRHHFAVDQRRGQLLDWSLELDDHLGQRRYDGGIRGSSETKSSIRCISISTPTDPGHMRSA